MEIDVRFYMTCTELPPANMTGPLFEPKKFFTWVDSDESYDAIHEAIAEAQRYCNWLKDYTFSMHGNQVTFTKREKRKIVSEYTFSIDIQPVLKFNSRYFKLTEFKQED